MQKCAWLLCYVCIANDLDGRLLYIVYNVVAHVVVTNRDLHARSIYTVYGNEFQRQSHSKSTYSTITNSDNVRPTANMIPPLSRNIERNEIPIFVPVPLCGFPTQHQHFSHRHKKTGFHLNTLTSDVSLIEWNPNDTEGSTKRMSNVLRSIKINSTFCARNLRAHQNENDLKSVCLWLLMRSHTVWLAIGMPMPEPVCQHNA